MVSLLIISHSASIARGAKELADQMVQGRVPIAAAGGTLDGALGTSTDLIAQALEQVRSPDGILVFVDLGSAVMSAEIALELSGERFLISRAALVEGVLVAAVQASAGASLEQVALVAERALEAKGEINPVPIEPPPPPPPTTYERTLTITHPAGLHMRPATLLVQTAARFKATLRAYNLHRPGSANANVKSILEVLKLGVAQHHRITISADGEDAEVALNALEALVTCNFGESGGVSAATR